ncbi:hypothetical protein PBCV1_a345L [Paramecium bursaria Chlorella virus 1]|uniref:Uncharacterized protein n=1 Tax=Paramecium bursaria Chlorella virus 1 TaxID=10506 RepID=Q84659_PBCV1|nr:hypothetical protein PBCV1_a345L [Paramecium bursaria Chlorella virus 1]AAC96713.1 hypothetical protein [Paramecium bursaria Chlorella virus 1]
MHWFSIMMTAPRKQLPTELFWHLPNMVNNLVVTRVSDLTKRIMKELQRQMSVPYKQDILIKLAAALALETVTRNLSLTLMVNAMELEVMSPKICVA